MAIDYNGDILQFYASRLEVKDEYIQEEASAVGGTYAADEVRGAVGQQISVGGDETTVADGVDPGNGPLLADWLVAIQSGGNHGTTYEASIIDDAIVIVGIGGVSLVIADGTVTGGLDATGLNAGTTVGGGDLETGRADQKNEQRILTTLGVLIAHLRLLGDRDESRNLHFVLSRIATGVGSGGFVYRDITASVTGNRKNPTYNFGAGADEIHLTLVNEGEGTVVTAAVPIDVVVSADDLDTLVVDINAAVTSAYGGTDPLDNMEASNDGGYLKLVSANGLTVGVVSGGNNDGATNKSGLEFGDNRSKRNEVAEKVKADALDYFDTNRRDLNL